LPENLDIILQGILEHERAGKLDGFCEFSDTSRQMKADTVKSHRERVLRVLVEIESNLSADLTLETLSRQGNFSPYHFHRVFRALVGESLKEYAGFETTHSFQYRRIPVIRIMSVSFATLDRSFAVKLLVTDLSPS
jgi:AraC-like DNA-binding protein